MFKRLIASLVCFTFIFSNLQYVHAQQASVLGLPQPGTMIHVSQPFSMATLRGVKVDVKNSLIFDFILDKGNAEIEGQELNKESKKLIKYFLTALTVPENDLWVNLSPYEKNRIIPEAFGKTEMGRDLLAQDYILKQLTASLVYPESKLGKEFWSRVYSQAQKELGTTDIPLNSFNKVWIMPDKASIFERGNTAFIVNNRLKVMVEEDYLSFKKHRASAQSGQNAMPLNSANNVNKFSTQIFREIIIPELTREVNEGKNFANVRQVYNSLLLAAWYRKKVKESILGQVFLDKNKIAGSELADKTQKQQIYDRYLKAFKKGVYNYIKEDFDTYRNESIPRKYFSGGMVGKYDDSQIVNVGIGAVDEAMAGSKSLLDLHTDLTTVDSAMGVWDIPEDSRVMSRDEVDKVFNQVEDLGNKWTIGPIWRNFWYALYLKYRKIADDKKSGNWWNDTLKIDEKDENGQFKGTGNFRPSAFLNAEKRQNWLGMVPYSQVVAESPNDKPHETSYMLLDGGAGNAFAGLDSLVSEIFPQRKNPKGAKGTDIPFSPAEARLLSPAEIKLMFLIKTVADTRAKEKKQGKEQGVESLKQATFYYEPILGPDSYTTYDELYDKTPYNQDEYLHMLTELYPDTTTDDVKSYRAVLNKLRITLNEDRNKELVTPNFPAVDPSSKEVTAYKLDPITHEPLKDKKTEKVIPALTFGSHGSIGVYIANQLVDKDRYQPPASGLPKIISFSNGDGINNFLDETTARWMAAKKIPVVMVVTTKTGVDKKGGQIGVEGTTVTDKDGKFVKVDFSDGKVKVRMLERADANTNGQLEVFERNGLTGGVGKIGQQAFNTNVIGVNEGVLAEILQRIYYEILLVQANGDKQRAMEEFNSIVAPDLIAGKDPIQLEGPIGTVFINLHNYIESTPQAKDILNEVVTGSKNGNARLLTLVSTDFEERSIFFTPVKNTLDWLLQAFSDYYTLDMESYVLKSTQKAGQTVPLPEFDVDDLYDAYKNVKNAIMAIPGITVDGQRVDITGKKVEIVERKIVRGGNQVSYYDIRIDGKLYPIYGTRVKIDKFYVQGLNLLKLEGGKNSGVVLFPGARLSGDVIIQNNTPHTINLYDYPDIPRGLDGRLILKDVKIVIVDNGFNKPVVTVGKVDNALVAQVKRDPMQDLGGIDFALDNIDLDINTDGQGIKFNIDPAMLKNGNFDGLVPLILSVSPINDLPMFLGAKEKDKEFAGA